MIFYEYSGTPLIQSPMGQKNLAVLLGRVKLHELRAAMSNIPYSLYIAFALAEKLFSLINNPNLVIIVYSKYVNYMYVKLSFSKTQNPLKKCLNFKCTVV